MMLKPIAAVLGAATVVGLVVIGANQMRAGADDAHTTNRASSSAQDQATGSGPLTTSYGEPRASNRIVSAPVPKEENQIIRETGGQSSGPTRTKTIGHRQERAKNGSYVTVVAGFYTGTGTAEVKDDKVSIKAEVVADDGRKGVFIANNLMFEGPYFSGAGMILDESVQVHGRLDAARASRLTATFTAPNGRAGRVVGKLPAALDAGDDNWDADEPDSRIPR